jgi:hypothetical protein
MTKAVNEAYLGDGLYASFDGFSIWLRAPRKEGDHYVALEPVIFEAFIEYAKCVGFLRKGGTYGEIKASDEKS